MHGTLFFGAKATWPKQSELRTQLDRFGPDAVIKEFEWTGRNSHGARQEAACKLRVAIEEVAHDPQTAESLHVVIAHSHGGNVALYALRDMSQSPPLASIVCMATPFIHARVRQGADPLFRAAVAGALFLLVAGSIVVFGGTAALVSCTMWLVTLQPRWWQGTLLFLLIAFVSGIVEDSPECGAAIAKRFLAELSIGSSIAPRVLVIREPGDEAQAGLTLSRIVSRLANRFNAGVSRLLEYATAHCTNRYSYRLPSRNQDVYSIPRYTTIFVRVLQL